MVEEAQRQHVSLELLLLVSVLVLLDHHMGSQVMEKAMLYTVFSVGLLLGVEILLGLLCILVSLDLVFETLKLAALIRGD